MTKRLSNEELSQIRERAEKATEGPWDTFSEFGEDESVVYEYDNLTETNVSVIAECETAADAAFIANACEDIPKLVAEIDRLKARVDEATSLLHLDTELIDKQSTEIERMREQLLLIYSDTFYGDTDYVSVKHIIRKRSEKALGGNAE